MDSRKTVCLALAIGVLFFCGIGLGFLPGAVQRTPRQIAWAQYVPYNVFSDGVYARYVWIDDDFDIVTGVPTGVIVPIGMSQMLYASALYTNAAVGVQPLAADVTAWWSLAPSFLGDLAFGIGDTAVEFVAGYIPGTAEAVATADESIVAGNANDVTDDDLPITIAGPASRFVPNGELLFPMAAASNIYVVTPGWTFGNTTFLPLRAQTDSPYGTDRVEFGVSGLGSLGSDDEPPFIGTLPDINALAASEVPLDAVAYGIIDPGEVAATAQADISVFGLQDWDANAIPEYMPGVNDPFMVVTPGAYVAQVPSADPANAIAGVKTYISIGSVGSDTASIVHLATGDGVLVAVPEEAVPANDARFLIRSAPTVEDLSVDLAELTAPTAFPMLAIDMHLVLGDGTELDELAAPITVRLPLPASMPRIGVPIFRAETVLDDDYNIIVPAEAESLQQAEIGASIENGEFVFQVAELTTYVPMYHPGAPSILDIQPDYGDLEGGTTVAILVAGHLDDNATVTFGGVPATNVNAIFSPADLVGMITCVTPAGASYDSVDVRVTNPQDGEGYALFAILEDGFSYVSPVEPAQPDDGGLGDRPRGGSGEPCFIATATYGSHAADELDVLRTFRDRYLLTNSVGTALVRVYYEHGPAVATAIARSNTLKTLTRAALRPIGALAHVMLVTPMWMKLAIIAASAAVGVAMTRRKKAA
jgi:hypothetical protein